MSIKQLHKKWREDFRNNVFSRDKYRCKICYSAANIDAHHITDRHEMPNGGYVIENGITLCDFHHIAAEKYHSSKKTQYHIGLHPNDLYHYIHSSFELAYKKSEELLNGRC